MAIATAPGEGALGLIRVSGADALAIAGQVLRGREAFETWPSHSSRLAAFTDPATGETLDRALCTVMRAPRSYTGENVVEISCHGSFALLRMVVEALAARGARVADPGEFTRRAFLNGRIDLARAEAVALLVAAGSERAVKLAARAVAGGLAAQIRALHEHLVDVIAGAEVALDFPEEGEGTDAAGLMRRVMILGVEVEALCRSTQTAARMYDGLTAVLIGPHNAGKSSIFNRLLGYPRALVSSTPGTTRDYVEGEITLDGVRVKLRDTAGLGPAQDALDLEAMRRSRWSIDAADVVIAVVDGSEPVDPDVLAEIMDRASVVVLSKSDLPRHAGTPLENFIQVSVMTPNGTDELREVLRDKAARAVRDDGTEGVATSLRQRELIEDLRDCIVRATGALEARAPEVALVDLKAALTAASAVLGIEVGDTVLDRIFARFCVGK